MSPTCSLPSQEVTIYQDDIECLTCKYWRVYDTCLPFSHYLDITLLEMVDADTDYDRECQSGPTKVEC